MCHSEERVGGSKFRVEFDGALQQFPSLVVLLSREPPQMLSATKKAVICFQVVGLLGYEPLLIALASG